MGSRRFLANEKVIGVQGQRKLSSACVAVAGLGGVGGIAFELLLRAGVGRIKIADYGFFEESNANRQLLWDLESDGRRKTKAAMWLAKKVNASCEIEAAGRISAQNSARFAAGCAAVIDATDTKESRLAVWQGCKKAGTPYIFASALGTRGMLSVFVPSKVDFENEFVGRGKRQIQGCDHSLGPVANAIGSLAAQQAINLAIGKKAACFPKVILLDAFSSEQVCLHTF